MARGLARTAQVGFVTVVGGKHAMLARHSTFDGLAADFISATLLGDPPGPVVTRVLAGESPLAV